MACFEMSLPKSNRIRLISAEGQEEFVEDEDFPLLQAAQLAKQVSPACLILQRCQSLSLPALHTDLKHLFALDM